MKIADLLKYAWNFRGHQALKGSHYWKYLLTQLILEPTTNRCLSNKSELCLAYFFHWWKTEVALRIFVKDITIWLLHHIIQLPLRKILQVKETSSTITKKPKQKQKTKQNLNKLSSIFLILIMRSFFSDYVTTWKIRLCNLSIEQLSYRKFSSNQRFNLVSFEHSHKI